MQREKIFICKEYLKFITRDLYSCWRNKEYHSNLASMDSWMEEGTLDERLHGYLTSSLLTMSWLLAQHIVHKSLVTARMEQLSACFSGRRNNHNNNTLIYGAAIFDIKLNNISYNRCDQLEPNLALIINIRSFISSWTSIWGIKDSLT